MSKGKTVTGRFRASLIGVLVGDCYGAPFERKKLNLTEFSAKFNKLLESKSGTVLKFTDDTAMTKSTCVSLLKNKGLKPKHLAKEYAESFFREPRRGYGPAVRKVFRKLRDTKYVDPYKPGAQQFKGSGSFGNGAAMRCNGIALFSLRQCLTEKQTIDLVTNCSRITHSHIHGINGAILLVTAIKYVVKLEEDTLDEITFLDHLIEHMSDLEDEKEMLYCKKLEAIKNVLGKLSSTGIDVDQVEIVKLLGNDICAQNSVPLAIYSFLRGISKTSDSYKIDNEFIRTLHWSISCGGDTDTIGSMACGLSGAYLGMEKIPESLYKRCENWAEMLSLADKLEALTS